MIKRKTFHIVPEILDLIFLLEANYDR